MPGQYEWVCQCTNCLEVVPTREASEFTDADGLTQVFCALCRAEKQDKGDARARKKRSLP